ncbi:hypothetical protein GUJ93_ZPchr0005g14445 [Zizania palustris]|uniref:AB hydrolase-1 domain-containing protein n=1 Tax=Zizania palustris TaxID=103762 RepID=A0A8J5VHM1_ZIZPA|nr:hypothetical protein GUJ93_ZPchr0005g14445 [Zizania palustris]
MDLSGQQPLRKDLYPHIEPYDSGFLNVSRVHTIYYEQSGNPQGHPVVFLHGGPGAGTSPSNRRFFDPVFFRIVLFDQRGAGRSTPHACLEENTTWDLVADIEKLREHLGIPEWQAIIVFGGSWGSTLALAYSQTPPDKVTGIVLRGIFLLRKKEIDWFYEGGAAAIFPDGIMGIVRDFIPEDERNCFIAAYNKRLTSSDTDVQAEAAKRWTMWEMMTVHLIQNNENIKRGEDDKFSLAFARIENHYFGNKGFLPSDSHLLDNVDKIRHIKAFIVQGRYDVCCPMMSAWDLHKAWPEAEFKPSGDSLRGASPSPSPRRAAPRPRRARRPKCFSVRIRILARDGAKAGRQEAVASEGFALPLAGCLVLLVLCSSHYGASSSPPPPWYVGQAAAAAASASARAGPSVTILSAPLPPPEGSPSPARLELAVRSWLALPGNVSVVLLGAHPSAHDLAGKLGGSVTVDTAVDLSFTGTPFFHSMVARAQASDSDISVLVDAEIVLLPETATLLKHFSKSDRDWFIFSMSRNSSEFPYHLADSGRQWMHADGKDVSLKKLQEIQSGNWAANGTDRGLIVAWNNPRSALVAGVTPSFLNGRGVHNRWLINEVLSSETRLVFDASNLVLGLCPENFSAKQDFSSSRNASSLLDPGNIPSTDTLLQFMDSVTNKEQNALAEEGRLCKRGSSQSATVSLPYSLEMLLQLAADRNRSIVLAVAGASYRDMLMSWVPVAPSQVPFLHSLGPATFAAQSDEFNGTDGVNRIGGDKCLEPNTNLTVVFLSRDLFPNGAYRGLWQRHDVLSACRELGCLIIHTTGCSFHFQEQDEFIRDDAGSSTLLLPLAGSSSQQPIRASHRHLLPQIKCCRI